MIRRALAALLLGLLATASQASPPAQSARLEAELKDWIQARIGRDGAGSARYSSVLTDLNGDGVAEALIYLSGPNWCGSGGCDLYILRRQARGWRLINWVSITKPPVRRLATRSRGWNDIGVYVSGGGILHGYEAVLRFDGRRYPGNPTTPPAFRARRGIAGRVLISRGAESRPVFP